MWKFILGLLLGLAARAVYDLFKDEPLPIGGLSTARIEAQLDETRQALRELRDDVRQAADNGTSALQARAQDVRAADTAVEQTATSPAETNGVHHLDSTPPATRGTLETMS